jgi:hypothetical protein
MADRSFYEKFRQTPEAQGLLRMLRFAEGTERGWTRLISSHVWWIACARLQAPSRQGDESEVSTAQVLINSCRTWQAQQKKLGLGSFGLLNRILQHLISHAKERLV